MPALLYPRVERGSEVWPAMFLPTADCASHPHPMRWDERVRAFTNLPCPVCDRRNSIFCVTLTPSGEPARLYFEKALVRHENPGTCGIAPVWIEAASCHTERGDDEPLEGWGR